MHNTLYIGWYNVSEKGGTIIAEMSKNKFNSPRLIIYIISFSLLFIFQHSSIIKAADLVLNNTPAQVYFSPRGGCTEAIVKEISQAKSEILIQAYSFTSKEIAAAIVKVHKIRNPCRNHPG